jgi:hypothetical protein
MTVSVTTSSSVAVSTTLATTTDGDIQTLDSYATEQALLDASAPDTSGLAMVLGGEATAIGVDTLAAADMTVELDGTGPVATAEGTATFVAVAASPGDETAFATADSFGGLSGADFQVVLTSNTQIVDQSPDESIAIATSSTALYGLDFDSTTASGSSGSDPMLDPTAEDELSGISDPTSNDQDDLDLGLEIEGNVATLDVTADASGEDTLLEVVGSVLTIEDTLSTVTGEIIAAVG